jgi:hypothetical protein
MGKSGELQIKKNLRGPLGDDGVTREVQGRAIHLLTTVGGLFAYRSQAVY